MKNDLSWNDIALFAAVARFGNLTRAAEAVGSSPATLSRRMTTLETQTGRRLFLHGAQGYTPTAEGRDMLAKAERMEAAAADIAQWSSAHSGLVKVRISAGTWTSHDLARNLHSIWSPTAAWVPEFVHSNQNLDIARREIDIGIRNQRPEQPWLAGQRTGHVDYAIYAKQSDVTGWIGPSDDSAVTRSARWILTHHRSAIVTRANDPHLALVMAEAGIGRVVLPMFVGEKTALIRVGAPIPELQTEEWLVSHHEGRHDPAIRAGLNALRAYLTSSDKQVRHD